PEAHYTVVRRRFSDSCHFAIHYHPLYNGAIDSEVSAAVEDL
ncbi:hypothetical protein AVEN_69722-1, partial [Araneus ventricosus]